MGQAGSIPMPGFRVLHGLFSEAGWCHRWKGSQFGCVIPDKSTLNRNAPLLGSVCSWSRSPGSLCSQAELVRKQCQRGPFVQEVPLNKPSCHICSQEMGLPPHSDTWWPQERASLPSPLWKMGTPLPSDTGARGPGSSRYQPCDLGQYSSLRFSFHVGSHDDLSLPGMLSVGIK